MKNIIYFSFLFVLISSCNNRFNYSETLYKDGLTFTSNNKLITGIVFENYLNDTLKFEIEYLKGKLNGSFKEYYDNGKLKKMGSFINGERNGQYQGFRQNGLLFVKGFYKNDKPDSLWVVRDIKGSVFKETIYNGNSAKYITYQQGNKVLGTNYTISGNIDLFEPSSEEIKTRGWVTEWRVRNPVTLHYQYDSIISNKWKRIFEEYKDFFMMRESNGINGEYNFIDEEFFNVSQNTKFFGDQYWSGTPWRQKFPYPVLDDKQNHIKWFLQNGDLFFTSKRYPPDEIIQHFDKERFEKDSLEGVYKNNRGGMYSIFETLHVNEYDEYLPSSEEMELLNDLLELY